LPRVGECRQCGECCRKLGWLLVHADDDTAEWIAAHDPAIKVEPAADQVGYYYVSIPYPCRHLIEIGDGKFACDMHDAKPAMCKRYPGPDDELKEGCGYRFVETDQ